MRIQGLERFAEEVDDFADALEEIGDEIDDAIDRGTRETALQVEKTASENAPVKTGELTADIAMSKLGIGVYSVGSTKDYAPPTEYGSAPHSITPNGPDPLKFYWEEKGTWVSTHEVSHPGTPAQPFLRPSLEKHRSDLVKNIGDEINELIKRKT